MTGWRWVAASCRGVSHERAGTRVQDAAASFVVRSPSAEYFVAVVCDGAGTASFGGEGASLVCRSFSVSIRKYFQTFSILPAQEQIEEWLDRARDLIGAVAHRRGLATRDFASTLVVAISNGETSLVAHVGDGCVAFKDAGLGRWVALIWPFHGEYASTTAFVTEDEGPRLAVAAQDSPISAVAAFSDGIERLALDFVSKEPFQPFFEGMIRPLLLSAETGRDRNLSSHLKAYLNSPTVNSRTDDDKSLVLAVRR